MSAPVLRAPELKVSEVPCLSRRVVCAAMRMKDGSLVTGVRHFSPDMRSTMGRIYGKGYHLKVQEHGFVDQWGVFMSRQEARVVAEEAGQILRQVAPTGKLYSENIY